MEQLELITETLSLPGSTGVTFTPRGLVISPDVSDADLIDIGHRLFATRGYVRWALGSVFAEMLARQRNGATPEGRVHFDDTFVSEFASAHGLDPKEKREMLGVYTFFARAGDAPALSFDHYREAMWATDDGKPQQLDRALTYLRTAHTEKHSVTAMRRTIRGGQATDTTEPAQPELAGYGVIFDFMRFAKRELNLVEKYTPERARIILADLGDATISYIDALRELARS